MLLRVEPRRLFSWRVLHSCSLPPFFLSVLLFLLSLAGGASAFEHLSLLSSDLALQQPRCAIRGTQESRATPLSTAQPVQPPKWSPKEAQRSQAKREERLARYQPRRGLTQTGLLANGRGFPGWDRPCHRLALVGKFRVSRTTTTAAKDWS